MLPSFLKGKDTKNIGGAGKKDNFIYRKLGKTGLELPIVSMGVMNAENPNLVGGCAGCWNRAPGYGAWIPGGQKRRHDRQGCQGS